MVREAEGLVKRLRDKLTSLNDMMVSSNYAVSSEESSLVHNMRKDIFDNKWIFDIPPDFSLVVRHIAVVDCRLI